VGTQTKHIDVILSNAEVVSANLKTSTGHINGMSVNFEKISNDIAQSNIKNTLDNANKAMADLQATIANINSTKGTLGLLMNDDKVYKNMDAATNSLNNLLLDLKAHPKRYVSFSVFGGKKD
jgi:phospholipid/cholesterol/gamma-HCH transport system substrate-binding protein